MSRSPRRRWRTTARAPTTLPSAAATAKPSGFTASPGRARAALSRVLRAGSSSTRSSSAASISPDAWTLDAEGLEIATGDGEVGAGQRILARGGSPPSRRSTGPGRRGGAPRDADRSSAAGPTIGQPAAHRPLVERVGLLRTLFQGGGPGDLGVGRLEPAQHGRRIGTEQRRQQHRIPRLQRRIRKPPCQGRATPPARESTHRAAPTCTHSMTSWVIDRARPQALEPFVAHPLGRELAQARRGGPGCLPGSGIDGEVEPGRKADRPENPEVVLPEPLRRVSHRAHQLPCARSPAPSNGSLHSRRSG